MPFSLFPGLDRLVTEAGWQPWLLRLAIALLIGLVGVWLARWLARALDKVMQRLQVDDIMRSFLRNLAYAVAVIVSLIAALDFAGVPTTSLLAVVGAAGLAVGLALKDSLSNIASGVMLIVLRPFHAGDTVQVAGQEGMVDSVRIFQTRLHTADNRVVFLPNSQITTAPIINYTIRGERRLDLTVGVSYDADIGAARKLLLQVANDNRRVKTLPAPEVFVLDLGETRISLQLRAWVRADDVGNARSELLEAVHVAFSGEGIRIPAPTREIHLVS